MFKKLVIIPNYIKIIKIQIIISATQMIPNIQY